MKKTIYTLAILAFATVTFSSCEKCIECTTMDGTTEISSEEYCGSKDEVDAYKTTYEAAGALTGLTKKCEDK